MTTATALERAPADTRGVVSPDNRSSVATPTDTAARTLVARRLRRLRHGSLLLRDRAGTELFGDSGVPVQAEIHVHRARFYRRVLTGGSLGLAESYLDGDWDTEELTALLRFLCRNLTDAAAVDRGPARVMKAIARVGHRLARNSRSGSRRNISAHYDLSNEFFELFLDSRMMYSSAVFERPGQSLEEAQVARLDRVCTRLDVRPQDHLVEIGTGWGGFAIHAARRYGCRVTTTTISQNQYRYAQERVAAAGLQDRVTVCLRDYRDLQGQFDKLVSLEMIEAVGHAYYDSYFRKCAQLLKPNGRMLLQAIVMPEQRYRAYLKSVDFIQRYVFPGGCLPSVTAMQDSVQRTSNLRLLSLEDFGPDYAATLRAWRHRFRNRLDDVRELGFTERFIRLWNYYLCYCEAAFDERATGVVHAVWGR